MGIIVSYGTCVRVLYIFGLGNTSNTNNQWRIHKFRKGGCKSKARYARAGKFDVPHPLFGYLRGNL